MMRQGASLLGLLVLAAIAACYRPAPEAGAPCGSGEPCPSGQSCVGGMCIAGDAALDACVAARCEGDTLVGCTDQQLCSYGCATTGDGAQCRRLLPSNGVDLTWLDGATNNLELDKLDLDTSDGSIKSANLVIRAAGEGTKSGIGFHIHDGMGVFVANRFAQPTNQSWNISGSNTLVLFAATTISIAGTIDVGGSGQSAGPGGFSGGTTGAAGPGCRGKAGLAFALSFGEGGGGAGGATAGGNGAPSNQATFGAGGIVCATPSAIPLRAGSGGGAGGIDSANGSLRGGAGGGGGGAIGIVAMESVTINGVIGAPGGGGQSLVGGDGGGGGGGGGAVLVEAPSVTITGALTANGGGGAGPSGSAGARGRLGDAVTAAGGSFNAKTGGRGGAGSTAPTNGQNYDDGLGTMSRGGGGGGASGKIEIRSINSNIAGTAITSPPATRTTAVLQ